MLVLIIIIEKNLVIVVDFVILLVPLVTDIQMDSAQDVIMDII